MKAVKIGILSLVCIFALAGIHGAKVNYYQKKYHELGIAAVKAGNVEFDRFYYRHSVHNAKTYAVALEYFYKTQKN